MPRLRDLNEDYLEDVLEDYDVAGRNRATRQRRRPKSPKDRDRSYLQLSPDERKAERERRRGWE